MMVLELTSLIHSSPPPPDGECDGPLSIDGLNDGVNAYIQANVQSCPSRGWTIPENVLSSFRTTCLREGGRYFTFSFDIECPDCKDRYRNLPGCVGANCNSRTQAQNSVDGTAQGNGCSVPLLGVTPGEVAGPPVQTLPPVPAPPPPPTRPRPTPCQPPTVQCLEDFECSCGSCIGASPPGLTGFCFLV